MSKSLRPHQTALLIAGAACLVAWAVPGVSWLLLPVQYLNTHLHEMCHAIAGIGTGGAVEEIIVRRDGSGLTPLLGGWSWIEAPAGYVGAAIIGAAVILGSRTEKGAKNTLRILAVLLGISALLWVRGDAVGVVMGWFWVVALALLSQLRGMWVVVIAQFIGLQQCLNSIHSVYDLVLISAVSTHSSDAVLMQQASGIPAILWAVLWCAFSLVLVFGSIRKGWGAGELSGVRAFKRSVGKP